MDYAIYIQASNLAVKALMDRNAKPIIIQVHCLYETTRKKTEHEGKKYKRTNPDIAFSNVLIFLMQGS